MSKYGVISGPYFPVFLRIQSDYMKIRNRNNTVFEHFSRSVKLTDMHKGMIININPLSANPTKWSNKLKQFVANYLSESDHFVELVLKGLKYNTFFI